LTTVPKGSGRLAGLAADPAGGWWSALRGGWSVARFDDDGSLARVIALPVPGPSGVAVGGTSGDTLYVTTAREAVTRESLEAAPLSGRLFEVRGLVRY
jgi:IclR family transcriptional regulator, acetate operon repressor